ncbi:dihydroorotate dehydrogenase electron transfer subunit [Archaeoglobus veneficus]|uniref:Probable dihydroorotate dehydrogenase B (NAD(+)), electron transfer subunit n=1 Tax=Archaeoglobus veneficus (strain DSM 11195 / SNP6) TaxID=693661 RepID=F2KR09_ARCVS|nr:dihydroorotate dehydrogenase electron transfer subunit [Archaeoglobus veneficus]AEA47815.1 oxidoreductase FAD/NAD(P)-binding domain protein [Archaeoglobus veneficus SNP6]
MYCVRVEKVVKHSKDVATIVFDGILPSYPGQFVMLNLFGYEEIPLSLSSPRSVTVKAVGETTRALVDISPGALVGIKGPMGNPFTPAEGKALLVAGGIGIAPLLYLHDYLIAEGVEVHVFYGARNADEIVCLERLKSYEVATDDGSAGFHGNVVELAATKDLSSYRKIYACGPEPMLKALYKLLNERELLNRAEFSLERYMKCGIGVCGSCVLENGLRVCVEGPVFSAAKLEW